MSGRVEGPPEARLWDWLDSLDVQFRQTKAELLAALGPVEELDDNGNLDGKVPGRPLMPGASGYRFAAKRRHLHALQGMDPSLPPEMIFATYRGADPLPAVDRSEGYAETNLATVIAALAPQLGPGHDTSDDQRCRWLWEFGDGQVEANCIPSHRHGQFAIHPPYASERGALAECRIVIQSGWKPPLTTEELGWLDGFAPVVPLGPVKTGIFNREEPWRRWRAGMGPRPPDGCGPSRDGKGFVAVSGDKFAVLPRNTLMHILRVVVHKVRWAGGVSVSLRHKPPEKMMGYPVYSFGLGDWPDDESDVYAAEARILAKALDLKLSDEECTDE